MNTKTILPNLLIVGAARSGTTSLDKYLNQHPEIFMSKIKEPCFFAFNGEETNISDDKEYLIDNYVDYLKLFNGSSKFKIKGEASTVYLYSHKTSIRNIKKYITSYEDLKIIIILRNPIERAFSQYMLIVKLKKENLSFEEAIKAEKTRMEQNYSYDYFYVDRGFYYKQVKDYRENFNNVRIYLYEDLRDSPDNLVKDILGFLGVDEDYAINTNIRHSISGVPKIKIVEKQIKSKGFAKRLILSLFPNCFKDAIVDIISKYNLNKTEMSDKTRRQLIDIYEKDINKLAKLINRDLSNWIK